MASAACRRRGLRCLAHPALRSLSYRHYLPSLAAPPHMVLGVWAQSRPQTYRGGGSGGASGGTSPDGDAPCVPSSSLLVSVVGVLASVPSSPTSTSVALCWSPPGGTSLWMLLGSLAAAAPSRATSKMPAW